MNPDNALIEAKQRPIPGVLFSTYLVIVRSEIGRPVAYSEAKLLRAGFIPSTVVMEVRG